eukprot:TRINITY_DN66202_c0_g1_i1.p1 TRINITY_DN66202_c0_g1~~TRINITY_DN66202_c0_g1_i1.p1  ORF type:complete len:677 (+),score=123.39 TRINITY_DN66202_c0_g1_i1:108-2033(+)
MTQSSPDPSAASSAQSYLKRMQSLQRIREKSGGQLDLAQICVVGDQSSGKSALLSELTSVMFPENAGICTRAPIVVQCQRKAESAEGNVFSYRDPQNGGQYVVCKGGVAELKDSVMRLQEAALPSGDMISMEEICVRVEGPEQMDVIVIDLPGIIHNGKGADESRQLIRKYCQPEQTLTLLVSEAKQDDELVSAIAMLKEYDPHYQRTLRVLTKFDIFDSKEAEARACSLVAGEQNHRLGAHAVACRHGGKDYDAEAEAKVLTGLPGDRRGVASLKQRLPAVFSSLIASNLPNLRTQAEAHLEQARQSLAGIGMEPIEGLHMVRQLQLHAADREHFERQLTPHLTRFKEAIQETGKRITKKWTDTKFEANAFAISVFQGNSALLACMQEIAELWWEKPLEEFVRDVAEEARRSLNLHAPVVGLSQPFRDAVLAEWARLFEEQILINFRTKCKKARSQEGGYGTVNHELDAKYKGGNVMPQQLMVSLSENLEAKVRQFTTEFAQEFSTYHAVNAPVKAGQPRPSHNPPKPISDRIRAYLAQERDIWVKRHESSDLFEQQKVRLLDAVSAVWAVEHKTFVDVVMKETRDTIIDRRALWIQHEIYGNSHILANATEEKELADQRESLQKRISVMQDCLRELDSV